MVTHEFVLALLLKAEPHAAHRSTFEATSVAIANASNVSPLFSGPDGPEKTAALQVGTAVFESGLIPDAEGDCTLPSGKAVDSHAGRCPAGSTPNSYCLLQVNKSNFKALGTTKEEIQSDINVCVRSALRLMHQSFVNCRHRPVEERLAFYAGGKNICTESEDPKKAEDARKKSRHRWNKGHWLYSHVPLPKLEDTLGLMFGNTSRN